MIVKSTLFSIISYLQHVIINNVYKALPARYVSEKVLTFDDGVLLVKERHNDVLLPVAWVIWTKNISGESERFWGHIYWHQDYIWNEMYRTLVEKRHPVWKTLQLILRTCFPYVRIALPRKKENYVLIYVHTALVMISFF